MDRIFEQAGLRREIAVEVSDVATAVELVRAGFGCAFLGASLVAGARPVKLCPVDPSPVFEVALSPRPAGGCPPPPPDSERLTASA